MDIYFLGLLYHTYIVRNNQDETNNGSISKCKWVVFTFLEMKLKKHVNFILILFIGSFPQWKNTLTSWKFSSNYPHIMQMKA